MSDDQHPGGKTATTDWWKRLADWYARANPGSSASAIVGMVEKPARHNDQVSTPMVSAAAKPALNQAVAQASTQAEPHSGPASGPLGGASIAAGYVASGPYDELVGTDGAIRAHWQPIVAGLDALTPAQRQDRMTRINARVRETGIAHDLFADPSRNLQPWHLDLMPLVFTADAWAGIEAAVIQRARLLEAVLADIYGPQTTLQSGAIPPALIFSDPAYLRACHGIMPRAGRIQFFAVDLARGADGQWRVVDTHVETPAGIGYALANRTVLTHVCGDIFSDSKAVRLAPFFQQLQDSLAQRIGRPDPSIALLTPGPRHNDFFSHAYLARYLGYQLVEGADLRAENGRVYLKTLDGLNAIDLLVRSVAGASCDALELEPSGFLGPVGLVQSVRQNPDLVVNALGTAIAENRGLGSFLPRLCQELLGEDLAIWDVTKWWLGDPTVRQTVIADLDRYFIRRANEQTARPGRAAPARDPAKLSPADRAALIEEIDLDGAALVAEAKTTLGTAPSYGAQGLTAKPYAVRIFATAVPGGFAVMPGGLAMTVDPGASMALTAPDGESRDVWVQSHAAQPVFRSLWRPAAETAQIQRSPRDLPSRAADNLFWLGRYTERADWTFRVLRNCLSRVESDSGPRQNLRLARAILTHMLERDGGPRVPVPAGLDEPRAVAWLVRQIMTSPDHAYGLPQTLSQMHRIAGLTRDRLSLEAWRTLNNLTIGPRWQAAAMPTSIGESLDLIDTGLAAVAAFNGLTHENMTRNFGWSFLDMGRRMSRGLNLALLLRAAFHEGQTDDDDTGSLLFVLELADSFITYRSRYRLTPVLPLVLDLLIMDETNPRGLSFQLAALNTHIDALPQTAQTSGRTELQRMALTMLNDVRLADVSQLVQIGPDGRRAALCGLLDAQIERVPQLLDMLTRRYFSVVEKEPRWVRTHARQE